MLCMSVSASAHATDVQRPRLHTVGAVHPPTQDDAGEIVLPSGPASRPTVPGGEAEHPRNENPNENAIAHAALIGRTSENAV
jgi:hypothetical protein